MKRKTFIFRDEQHVITAHLEKLFGELVVNVKARSTGGDPLDVRNLPDDHRSKVWMTNILARHAKFRMPIKLVFEDGSEMKIPG